MFSPAAKKSNFSSTRKNNLLLEKSSLNANDSSPSPVTPLRDGNAIPNRPPTGTPAPWASRLSVLARISPVKRNEKAEDMDLIRPVYVGEFPAVVRDEQQAMLLKKHPHGDVCISGGMDKESSLAWVICRNKFFVWSYLSPTASRRCVVLDLPSSILANGDANKRSSNPNNWFARIIDWDSLNRKNHKVTYCKSAGVILCNRRTRTLVYWPDIYSDDGNCPVTSYASLEESEAIFSPGNGKASPNKQQQHAKHGSNSSGLSSFNSLITTPIPGGHHICVALACSSSGELWQFLVKPSSVQRINLSHMLSTAYPGSDGGQYVGSKGYPRSVTWSFIDLVGEPKRQFLLLRDNEIQCFSIKLTSDYNVSKLWSQEIIGTDGDLGIQKDLAGQKRIWPLDLQVDGDGKVITILIAIFCKDRITSSSYTEYSILTMQYRSGVNVFAESVKATSEKVLEKKAPIQVIIPKARVEDEEFLFSMRLKTGGKPAGSVIILSGDGTATVSHYWRNSTRLYQFDLPYDAGKILDASVFPSSGDGEDGAWAVLTEKAGVWAIPERAVLLGGVEPPERSLSRKGSSNERSAREERKNFSLGGNIPPRRASSEAWDTGDRQRAPPLSGIARRNAQDEESEALLNQVFHDFLVSGQADGALDKLRTSGAFERDGETNVIARTSKSIVDTLAKHWTTTRGAEIVALSIVSTQLLEKKQKHKKFLQFLALSKCHEELCSRQRQSLQIIMEHGEKLTGIIQLRELQDMICQSRANALGSSHSCSETQGTGALWDLIQLVGERARRKTVLLMDRENAEVFYSKVSDVEEMFYCLERHLDYLITCEMSFSVQFQRACELSSACINILQTSMHYRNEHHLWYPSPEGLTPWYCQTVVRSGLWSIASFMLQLVNETSSLDNAAKSDFYSHLEVLSDVLLNSYSGAITAKIERNEDHKGLLDEYWKRRDALLDSLYMQVKGFFEAKLWDSRDGTEDQNGELLRQLSSSLLPIAKRHEGYQTLWSICCDLNDLDLLRSLMHESMGPKGGFCNFVFKQMYDNKQYFKLMRLGEEFQEELAIFLKQHPHLRWLHEIFLNQFHFASESLHTLAFSEEDGLASANEKPDSCCRGKTFADRKCFLHLSMIAAMAGKDTDYTIKVKRIEADLNILKLQEEILKVLPDNDEKQKIEHWLLPPVDLIELCLKSQNRVLALRAFDVFAWTSLSFLKCNSSLLEECWRNAANQDDWESIYQMSLAEGWSDEETFRVLSGTILFQASSRCYGPKAKTFEGSFDEVLPPRQESLEHSYVKDIDSSVEAILMQHKDFPDAGKLMLTAIMLGSDHGGTIDDRPSPME